MHYLLDTHTFLWFLTNDKQLPKSAAQNIKNLQNTCWISIASIWEIVIKANIGKLDLQFSLQEIIDYLQRNQISVLTIELSHLLLLNQLPPHHKDPFDRIIISQAIAEKLVLISDDAIFKKYAVDIAWH